MQHFQTHDPAPRKASFRLNGLVGAATSRPPGWKNECLVEWNNVQRGTNSPILVGNGKLVPRWWLVAAPTMDEQAYCQLKTASFMPFKSSTPYAKPFLTNSSGRYSSYLSNRGSSLGYTSSMGSMGFWISSCTTR